MGMWASTCARRISTSRTHDFSVVYDDGEARDANHGHIRFGLGAVKGVGAKAVAQIIEVRKKDGPFRSLFDFCERVPQGVVNKSVIEALIKCGAFDSLHGTEKRSALVAAIETAISRGQQEASLRTSDDFLFGEVAKPDAGKVKTEEDEPTLPNVSPWDSQTTLSEEKSVLGFYVSAHPLDRWRKTIETYANVMVRDIRRLRADAEVILGGMFTRIRPTFVKNGRSAGQRMAMITVEDHTGSIDGVVFSDTYAQYAHLLESERIVFMHGRVDRRREEPSVVIDEIIPAEEAAGHLTRVVKIRINSVDREGRPRKINGELSQLRNMLRQMPGNAQVYLECACEDRTVLMSTSFRVRPTANLPAQVDGMLRDTHCCTLIGPDKVVDTDPGAVLGDGDSTVVNRLQVDQSDVHCESIDRY
jgi:DNA polymerase-3 subunit alpha